MVFVVLVEAQMILAVDEWRGFDVLCSFVYPAKSVLI
jgi:hypothetical protein